MNELLLRRRLGAAKPYDAEVEYIETDGDAYIDTGVKVASTLTFEISLYFPANPSSWWVFGGRGSSSTVMGFQRLSASGYWRWNYGSKYQAIQLSDISQAGIHTFKNTSSSNILLKDNTTTFTCQTATFSTQQNFYLFTQNNAGTPNMRMPGERVSYAKFYSSGTLARDFIPVRVGQVGYLYDKVSGRLFGNANSTGSFGIGNDVV